MAERFVVRQAQPGDAAAMSAFMSDLVAERLPVLFRKDRAPTEAEEREFIERIGRSPRNVLLLAEANGRIVGVLDFQGDAKVQRAHSGAFGLSVAREWRRCGVATGLLAHLLEWAKGKGLWRIELEVMSNNLGAVALYERAGFRLEGAKVRAVEVDGEYVDLLQMARLL